MFNDSGRNSERPRIFPLVVIGVLLLSIFLMEMFGDPYTMNKVEKSAEKYLEENYPNQNFYVDKVTYELNGHGSRGYVSKRSKGRVLSELFGLGEGEYIAHIKSIADPSISFNAFANGHDKVYMDDYGSDVINADGSTY